MIYLEKLCGGDVTWVHQTAQNNPGNDSENMPGDFELHVFVFFNISVVSVRKQQWKNRLSSEICRGLWSKYIKLLRIVQGMILKTSVATVNCLLLLDWMRMHCPIGSSAPRISYLHPRAVCVIQCDPTLSMTQNNSGNDSINTCRFLSCLLLR